MFSFTGRTALVSGGTSGIGLAIARAFAAAGATVHAVGLGTLPADAPNIHFGTLDVTDTEACRSLVAAIPRIDFLVTAAGIVRREGTQKSVVETMQTREELYESINYHEYEKAIDKMLGDK